MASSRLKRRLDNNPDATSQYGSLDGSFVEIGTALPSLASTKRDTNEFKPLWEQEVFDDQGRKRLHGAFTGGFSAGYYNTVGSKEGWTPSTFKSSRAERSTSDAQGKGKGSSSSSSNSNSLVDAAKQFMDQEDLEELASSRQLETSSYYAAPSAPSSSYDPLMGFVGGITPSASTSPLTIPSAQASLASLTEPSSSRIGAKLMRKMGWRPGQGCGPRLTKAQRKKQALELGTPLEDSVEEEEEDDEDEQGHRHYYAPLDRPLMVLSGVSASRDKGRGLGYDRWGGVGGERRKQVQEERLGGEITKGKGRRMEEEEDPYAESEEMGSRRGEVMELMMDEDEEGRMGEMERMGRRRRDGVRNTLVFLVGKSMGMLMVFFPSEQVHPSNRAKGGGKDETFHDGVKVLSGFVLHHEPYKPPTTSQLPSNPPKEWRPNPTKVWADEKAEAMESTVAPASAQQGKENRGHTQLSADQRGTLLGEKIPPPPPKSVFEYLSSKDKERLSTLSTTGHLPPSSAPPSGTSSNLTPLGGTRSHISRPPLAPTPSQEPDEEFTIPLLDSSTASLALRGFQPFSSASTSPDPTRQARYTLFLQYSAHQLPPSIQGFPFGPRSFPLSSPTSTNTSSPPSSTRSQTMKELNKELRDYVAAAKVFKPVSGMLGNRFTSGTSASALLVPQVEPGLYTPPVKTGKKEKEKEKEEEEIELTPVQQTIQNDRFGPLTRTTSLFKPDKLLCKRFGVADPFSVKKGEEEEEGGGRVGGKWKEATMEGDFKVPVERHGGRKVRDVLGKESMDELIREANGGMMPSSRTSTSTTTKEDLSEGPIDHFALATSTRLNTKTPLPTLETVGLGDDERQGEETLTYEKAPRDIFEAIFKESDDEDSEEEDYPLEGMREVEGDAEAMDVEVELPPKMGPTMMFVPSGPTLAETTTLLSSETVVDYKPTFVNRSSNKSVGTDKDKNKDKKKKKKKEMEKRKAGTLSFDLGEEDEVGGGRGVEREKVVKKVEKEKEREGKREENKVEVGGTPMDSVDEWEEAPSIVHPSIVASLSLSSSSSSGSSNKREEGKVESAIGPGPKVSFEPVKRARAADLF